jgi:hypothetical protein
MALNGLSRSRMRPGVNSPRLAPETRRRQAWFDTISLRATRCRARVGTMVARLSDGPADSVFSPGRRRRRAAPTKLRGCLSDKRERHLQDNSNPERRVADAPKDPVPTPARAIGSP